MSSTDSVSTEPVTFSTSGITRPRPLPSNGRQVRAAGTAFGDRGGDKLIPYPFQYNLWALESPSVAHAAITELRRGLSRKPHDSFRQRLQATWGSTCFAIFVRPYDEKLWAARSINSPADCAGDYMPSVDVALVERGASRSMFYAGYNAELTYPPPDASAMR